MTISADGNPDAIVPLNLRVHDFTVPTRGRLKTAFALMQGFLEKVYGATNVTPKLRQAYGDFLLAHRLNPDDITRTDLPHLDDLAHYRDRGLNAFNVLNMVRAARLGPLAVLEPGGVLHPGVQTESHRETGPVRGRPEGARAGRPGLRLQFR